MELFQILTAVMFVFEYVPVHSVRHTKVIMSSNLTDDIFQLDGATIMSNEYFKDKQLKKLITIKPISSEAFLLVKFVYLDILKLNPCMDKLTICESTSDTKTHHGIVEQFCGDMEDLFPSSRFGQGPHFITTSFPGYNLLIQWVTSDPIGMHRGFQLTVTSFIVGGFCSNDGLYWQCQDGRCINADLHCDGITHCTDGSDEMVNCTRPLYGESSDCSVLGGEYCPIPQWTERWFGLAIPLIIVMVLLFIAVSVRVRRQLCTPTPVPGTTRPRRRRRRRIPPSFIPQSRACTLEPMSASTDPVLGMVDGVTLMLLPPPYSSRECIHYDPPLDGDPPPLYETSIPTDEQSKSDSNQEDG